MEVLGQVAVAGQNHVARPAPTARVVRCRLLLIIGEFAVGGAALGFFTHDPLAPLLMGALSAVGVSLAVLMLDERPGLGWRGLTPRQRRIIIWLIVLSGAAFGLAVLLRAVGIRALPALGGALFLALGTGTYAVTAYLRAVGRSRGTHTSTQSAEPQGPDPHV